MAKICENCFFYCYLSSSYIVKKGMFERNRTHVKWENERKRKKHRKVKAANLHAQTILR